MLAGRVELDLEPRLTGALGQLGDVLDPRGWGAGRLWAIGFAQNTEDRSQLSDRFMACLLDRLQRRASVAWCGSFSGRGCLDVDLGQGVGDDVVQFASDPQPFLFGASGGFLLAGALGEL